jgi:hypothetical protein
MMTSSLPCEIIFVKQKAASGWKWRPVVSGAAPAACKETYPLFYDCVIAARALGYSPPNLKCR